MTPVGFHMRKFIEDICPRAYEPFRVEIFEQFIRNYVHVGQCIRSRMET